MLTIGDAWKPDKVIVLTSGFWTRSKSTSGSGAVPRGCRGQHGSAVSLIDDEFRRLAPAYPDAIVVDRDGKEFHERAGLVEMIKLAGLPAFEEIAYEQIERFEDRRG